MPWPVLYINTVTREPLKIITRDEWCGSLAARYALSHVSPGNHFFVDGSGQVYELAGRGMISPGFQLLEPRPVDKPEILDMVRRRAQEWLGSAPDSIGDIIAEIERDKRT